MFKLCRKISRDGATVLSGKKIYINEKRVNSTTGIETCLVESSHPTVIDDPRTEDNIAATHMLSLRQWNSN